MKLKIPEKARIKLRLKAPRKHDFIRLLLIAIGLVLILLGNRTVQGGAGKRERFYWVPKANYIKAVSLEYKNAISDFFWMKVTLTYGDRNFDKKATPKDWEYLAKLTDLVTDLDPRFFIPYMFAASVLSWEGNMPEEAIKILKKGLDARRDDWRIPFYMGFNYFYFLGDSLRASQYLIKASRLPGSPKYLPLLATRLRSRAGDIKTAIRFLQGLLNTIENEQTREKIMKRLKALKDIDYLQTGVKIYRIKKAKYPQSLRDLLAFGIIDSIPHEPYGGYYTYDPKTGRVWSSTDLGKKVKKE